MMIFGVCFVLYLIKLSGGKGFCTKHVYVFSVALLTYLTGEIDASEAKLLVGPVSPGRLVRLAYRDEAYFSAYCCGYGVIVAASFSPD